MITVRNIVDVALSFFEKHRAQANLARFSDEWVEDYCVQETEGIVSFQQCLEARGVPTRVARYEDFVRSAEARKSIEQFLGWTGGGKTERGFTEFERGFEVERHGTSISPAIFARRQRRLARAEFELAAEIGERCDGYQRHFGYDADSP